MDNQKEIKRKRSESSDNDKPEEWIPDFELCPFGDLLVVLTTTEDDTKTYLVSSAVLRLASKVWGKSLDPKSPFGSTIGKEPINIGGRSVQYFVLQEDDPDALLMVFLIIHHCPEKTPKSVTFEQLLQIAVVCDKYNCTSRVIHVVRPWLELCRQWVWQDGFENWLFIGPTFGETVCFEYITQKLLRNIKTQEENGNKILMLHKRTFDDSLIPPKIMDDILNLRGSIFENTMSIVEKYMNLISSATVTGNHDADSSDDYKCTEACISLTYGSLVRILQQGNYYQYVNDIGKEERHLKWDGSIAELFASLESLELNLDALKPSKHMKKSDGGYTCGLRKIPKELRSAIKSQEAEVKGLKPDDYVRFKQEYGEWGPAGLSKAP